MNASPRSAARAFGETAAVFAAVVIGYVLLLSPMLVDDAARYLQELGANRFYWDLGHVWMQPLALLLYRGPLHGLGVNHALEAVNVASVALGAAVFHATLRRLGHGAMKSLLGTAFVALSFNLISLGPTAHIKLMAFPTLALSLREAVLWESAAAQGRLETARAWAAGAWLGAGTTLLVSVLPAAFFVAAFMVLRGLQSGATRVRALAGGAACLAGVAVAGAVLTVAAYATAVASGTTAATGLLAFVLDGLREKESLHVFFLGWLEVPFRFVFSLVYNFVFLPSLGSMGRAWLWGLLPDPGAHVATLAAQALVALLSVAALAAIAALGLRSVRRPAQPLLLAMGFVLGASTFSLYYNLNDPEHWFHFTLPIAFIAVHAQRRWLDRLVFGLWLPAMVVANLGLYAIPKARFDLEGREQAFARALGPVSLYVGYAAYPGEPDISMLATPAGAERFNIDIELTVKTRGDVELTLQRMEAQIDSTLARGGRVLVFRAVDPTDWRGPVLFVSRAGLTRARLQARLSTRYVLSGPVDVAGFPAWELRRRPGP